MEQEYSDCVESELDLAPFIADPLFRSDLLFFIRLVGTYCQTIFWASFAKSAKKRRAKMLKLAEETISSKDLLAAIIDPNIRRRQTTDILNGGLRSLLEALKKESAPQGSLSINDYFSKGLRERYGLPWDMEKFIASLRLLIKYRGFLEHYEQKLKNKQKPPSAKESAELISVLGLLLLPQFSNELEQVAKRIKNAEGVKIYDTESGRKIVETMRIILEKAKEDRKNSIKFMFAEARARKNMYPGKEKTKGGKFKNKTQKSYELLNGKWRRYYYGLRLSNTDLRENNFKRYYDFIGEQNFKQIYALLGSPLADNKLKTFDSKNLLLNPYKITETIYESEKTRLSFKNDIIPLYITIVRIQKLLHFYLNYAPMNVEKKDNKKNSKVNIIIKHKQIREIRNNIAHNGLFWQVKNVFKENTETAKEPKYLSPTTIFYHIIRILVRHDLSNNNIPSLETKFCEAVDTILGKENCAIGHIEAKEDAPPAIVKIRKFGKKPQRATELTEGSRDNRVMLRLALTKWQKNLQKARKTVQKRLVKCKKKRIIWERLSTIRRIL